MAKVNFFLKQILGMEWLNDLIGLLLKSITSSEFVESRIGSSIQFFIYDLLKISILLCVLIFIISYIQSYFPPERTKKILSRYQGMGANILGALLGTVTPFCSCSSIPIFIGFTKAGLPTGVTFSFLISSPLVDLGSLVLLTGIFGFGPAIIYVIVGLILAVISGSLIDKSGLGRYVEDFVSNNNKHQSEIQSLELTKKMRIKFAKEQVQETYRKVILFIVIGVAIGALIHNWIPQNWIESILGSDNIFAVVIATVIGAPMYGDIFGTIPIAEALFDKGVGIGTIISFMMSVTALSIPSLIMLRRVVKPKLLFMFIVIVLIGIIITGYGFNFFENIIF